MPKKTTLAIGDLIEFETPRETIGPFRVLALFDPNTIVEEYIAASGGNRRDGFIPYLVHAGYIEAEPK